MEELLLSPYPPANFEKETVAQSTDQAMTLMCPVAPILNKAVKLTWEYHLSR